MKTVKILLLILTLSLISCDGNDDGFYNSEYLSIPNLVTIETQTSYAVNDYLYVNSTITRLQTEENQTTPLDLRKSTGNAPSFNFTYVLERKVGTEWEIVQFTNANTIVSDGHLFSGGFVDAYADYNTTTDSYNYRVGIQLQNTGEYRLSFGYNSGNDGVDLRSVSSGNNVFLNINSAISNLSSEGYYLFTVN